jgi:hypothetical protein
MKGKWTEESLGVDRHAAGDAPHSISPTYSECTGERSDSQASGDSHTSCSLETIIPGEPDADEDREILRLPEESPRDALALYKPRARSRQR